MAEYIDREALIERLKFKRDNEPNLDGRKRYGLDSAISQVRKAPTADVVEVVRCRECEYWQDNNGGYPHPECRWGKDETPDADDFCSYGERKGDCNNCNNHSNERKGFAE
jgi:hypothetical protein